MKKVYYLSLVVGLTIIFSMCSKTSTAEEEKQLTEAFLENEKIVIDPSQMEEELFNLVNEHRSSIGASQLQNSSSSYVHAQEHSNYMISQNELSHDNFDARASKIALEINAVNVSENVARYYSTASAMLNGWLNSASHKSTLEGEFTHATLNVELDKNGRAYCTQIFMKVD